MIIFTLFGCHSGLPSSPQALPVRLVEEPRQAKDFFVVLFCRADTNDKCEPPLCFQPQDHSYVLEELYKTGWEYVGPLNSNGINCQYVAFSRNIDKQHETTKDLGFGAFAIQTDNGEK